MDYDPKAWQMVACLGQIFNSFHLQAIQCHLQGKGLDIMKKTILKAEA
jgi:hypothetical protein